MKTARASDGEKTAASWLDFDVYSRCIIRSALPRLSTGYNNNYEIVQSPGYVAIMQEQMHDTRIIPVGTGPHLPATVRQWLGDSRGHWEATTLVVETTNFHRRSARLDVPVRDEEHDARRALHARQRPDDRLPVHRVGSRDVDASVDGEAAVEPD
mgnify:CR=1 FL=1